ncbi:hypothetical protein JQM63_10245 [Oscillibacter valericigenes]|nr:hypothetical protein [Oscillibacter valericigenes]
MNIILTKKEALVLYKIILRWDETGLMTIQDEEEQRLFWDLHCVLEKELEPVDVATT